MNTYRHLFDSSRRRPTRKIADTGTTGHHNQLAQRGGTRNRFNALRVSVAVLASMAICSVGVIAPVSAAPSKWETDHTEYGDLSEDFCGVSGLTVQLEGVADGRFRATEHGSDGVAYYFDFEDVTETYTNVATGDFVTVIYSFRNVDLHVTDNGDGTQTILVQGSGNFYYYNEDGQLIGHDAGLSRFEVLFDDAGTPTDRSDDVFLDFLGFVKDVGTPGGDFCATVVQAIG
jgi:hypothetical protein